MDSPAPDPAKPAGEASDSSAASAGGPSGPRPPDRGLREHGLQLVIRLAGLIRIGRAYQVGNHVFDAQLAMFVGALEKALADCEEVVLVALDSDLYVNGLRIPVRSANIKFHTFVLEQLDLRRIAGFRAERGVTPEEIAKFFGLFMRPDENVGTALLEACLAAGCDKMQPAVHASAYSADYDFGPLGIQLNDMNEADESDRSHEKYDGLEDDNDSRSSLPGRAPRGAARKSFRMAVQGTRSLLAPTSLNNEMEMRLAKRVVQPLVDGAFDREPVVVGLTSLGHHDEFTYAHAVNVTLVAVTIGHAIGLDRRALADLGVAALLHDLGKGAVADLIHNPFDEFTEDEKRAARRHPVEGVKILARSTALNPTTLRTMRVSLEHHMVANGRGYPTIDGWTPSALSQVVAVADAYVSLQTYRSRHGANVTPFQALGMVLGPMRSNFNPYVLWGLVQTVGLYPPGQLVELDDGRIAVVLAPNRKDLERPHVRVIARADRRRLAPEEREDLHPLPVTMNIARALKAEEYPEDPDDDEATAA
jgi:HD-GYP domain-containing protein (c-di-GMP phosphodiesterase class II)